MASSAVARSLIAAQAAPPAAAEASANARKAAPLDNSPAARVPSTLRAQHPAASAAQAVPEAQAVAQASASVPASAVHAPAASANGLVVLADLAAQRLHRRKRLAPSAPAMPEAAAGVSSTPRPRKAR